MFSKRFIKPVIALTGLLATATVWADLIDAQRYYDQGRNIDALAEVETLLALRPGDAEARFLQGIIYAEMGRSDDAIEVFAGLTQDYPELPEPYNNLAVLFAEQGEFDKAREALITAIQTHPSYSTAHENLGDLYAKMAGIAYDRALTEDRANESARIKLSGVNGLFSVPRNNVPAAAPTQVARVDTPPAPTPAPSTTPRPAVETPTVQVEPATRPVVTPRPAPVAASTPAAAPADLSADVADAVLNWRAAWSAQDVDGYLGAYGPSFAPPNGASRGAWSRYRRERLNAPSFIEVEVTNLQIQMLGADQARAVFVQGYRSDNYQDQVRKTLMMERTAAGWQIASETSEAL